MGLSGVRSCASKWGRGGARALLTCTVLCLDVACRVLKVLMLEREAFLDKGRGGGLCGATEASPLIEALQD